MTDVVAIIAVKKKSNRLKNKNVLLINNKPLFLHTIDPLIKSKKIKDIYIATNSGAVKDYCKYNTKIKIIWRGPNKSKTNEPLIDVLKFSYSTIQKSYKYIITILANAPGHTVKQVNDALTLIKKKNLSEVRSFNAGGEETGLIVFNAKNFSKKKEISSYIGMIKSSAKEIHFRSEWLEEMSIKYATV
mgnify:CR=1 FL=1